MASAVDAQFSVRIANSITAIPPAAWDALAAGGPFQSHRWYEFGERVMSDCKPIYILVQAGEALVARAALWCIANEPLPLAAGLGRTLLQAFLKRWPLCICRSPLAQAPGLILPTGPLRAAALERITVAALAEAKKMRCSFVVFDFLTQADAAQWPADFSTLTVADPGMIMANHWHSLEEFLAAGNKKDRQHYKRTLRAAAETGITLTHHAQVQDIPAALALIRTVERRYGNPPNPWMRGLLENMQHFDGIWLEARQNGKLVGGGLILEDNATQMTTALGLAEDVPYVYLMLVYASLNLAFQEHNRWLRWGSGAYELKQQLGFVPEGNNYIVFSSVSRLIRAGIRLFQPRPEQP